MELDQKINKMIYKNNSMINSICNKYRLYPKLVSYPLSNLIIYTWTPDIWKWIYHYLEVDITQKSFDISQQLFSDVEVLEGIYEGKEYFDTTFISRLRDKIERSKENG